MQIKTSEYNQDPRLPPNILVQPIFDDFNTFYILAKRVFHGDVYLGSDDTWAFSYINKMFVLLGKSDSRMLFDYLKTNVTFIPAVATNPVYKNAHLPTIPPLLLKPKEVDHTKIYYNDAIQSYSPIEPKYGYMTNFVVTWDSNRSPYRPKNKADHPNIVRRGYAKMFHQQLKPRALSPIQTFVSALFSYTCTECSNKMNFACHCYRKSHSIYVLLQFITLGKGIPFHINVKDSQCVKLPTYAEIPSVLPTLWYAFLELSLRVTTQAIDEAMESAIVSLWMFEAQDTLFGSALNRMKQLKALSGHILSKIKLVNIAVTSNNDLYGSVTLPPEIVSDSDPKKWLEVRDAFNLTPYLVDVVPLLDDYPGRQAYMSINQMITIPMTIQAPIVLNLEVSARATLGAAPMLSRTTEWILINNDWVPIHFTYDDDILEEMRRIGLELIERAAPRLDNLEIGFLEHATTNSAGLDKDTIENLKQSTIRELGDTPAVQEYLAFINNRLFDAMRIITTVAPTIDSLVSEWYKPRVTGTRHQVGRRPRAIQMVSTAILLPAFVKAHVLEKAIEQTPYAVSGKTTNDIRDMHKLMFSTGRNYFTNSIDIVGMDTSTWPKLLRFVSELVLLHLETKRQFNYPYFTNKDNGRTLPIKIQKRTQNPDGTFNVFFEEVSVLEFHLCLSMAALTSNTTIKDVFFGADVKAPNGILQSGIYETGPHNTIVNALTIAYAQRRLDHDYPDLGLQILGGALGDDHITTVTSPFDLKNMKAISVETDEIIRVAFSRFGLLAERDLKYKSGEFLKLQCVAGIPNPYQSRLALFTSERGEDYSRSTIARLTNSVHILNEISARVPRPENTVPIMRAVSAVLSYATLYTSTVGKTKTGSYKHKKVKAFEKTLGKDSTYKNDVRRRVKDAESVETIISWNKVIVGRETEVVRIYVFPGAWYTVPNIGVPTYGYINGRSCEPPGYYTAFPSPATMRRIFASCRLDDTNIRHVQAVSLERLNTSGFDAWRESFPVVVKRYIDMRASSIGKENYTRLMNSYPENIPINTIDQFDIEKGRRYGFVQAYHILDKLSQTRTEFTPGPVLTQMMRNGDAMLDPAKSFQSAMAKQKLKKDFGIVFPELQTYYRRISARMISAATEMTAPITLDANLIDLFNSISTYTNLHRNLKRDIVFGDYTLLFHPLDTTNVSSVSAFDLGFGSAVKPHSMTSIIIDLLGLPRVSSISRDAIKDSVNKDLLIPGASEDVLKTLARVYKSAGSSALELAFTAVGVPTTSREKILKLFRVGGVEFASMPYALNPRQMFYTNTNPMDLDSRFIQHTSTGSIRYQNAVYLSELLTNPALFTQRTELQYGPGMLYASR